MNRREFFTALGVVGAAAHVAAQGPPGLLGGATVRADWLGRHVEPVLEPQLQIIDPHHHLWIRPGSRYLADGHASASKAANAGFDHGHRFVRFLITELSSAATLIT